MKEEEERMPLAWPADDEQRDEQQRRLNSSKRMPAGGLWWCMLLLTLTATLSPIGTHAQDLASGPSASASPSSSVPSSASASFVLADPNHPDGAAASAYSPPAEPSPILPPEAAQQPQALQAPADFQQKQQMMTAPASADAEQPPHNAAASPPSAATAPNNGGYGTLMSTGTAAAADDPLPSSAMLNDAPASPQEPELTSAPRPAEREAKGRQFNQYPVVEPALLAAGMGAVPAAGTCPGGASLPIECDPKRPWPQCPPQSYCYATNTVDIGPYFCCPIWSTYGAAWRPATPFYSYAPPPPPNWPEPMRMASYGGGVGPVRKERKEQRFDDDGGPLMTPEEQRKILQVMNDWVERQKDTTESEAKSGGNGTKTASEKPNTDRTPSKL